MKKNNSNDYDGFMVNVFLDEDGDYLAHLVELPNISAFGSTPAKALDELKIAWELTKECYEIDGEPIPKPPSREGYEGPCSVPIDRHLYNALTDEAANAGISLYALVSQKLKSNVPYLHEDTN